MTKEQALKEFFSGFGIDAYPHTSVPQDAEYPYLTHETVIGGFDEEVNITVNIWYYTEGESEPNAKVREIYEAIGLGGTVLLCDGGAIWLKRGSPWCQSLTDDDIYIKRRYINVTAEYITN